MQHRLGYGGSVRNQSQNTQKGAFPGTGPRKTSTAPCAVDLHGTTRSDNCACTSRKNRGPAPQTRIGPRFTRICGTFWTRPRRWPVTAEEWIRTFAEQIGSDPPDQHQMDEILRLAAIAAHASERIAAPIACYLAGTKSHSLTQLITVAEGVGTTEERLEGEGSGTD